MTYPKDGERKLKETVKQLKMQVGRLRKENSILRNEIDNIAKPVRPRKEHVEEKSLSKPEMTHEEWRREFSKRNKPALDKRLREIDNEDEEQD